MPDKEFNITGVVLAGGQSSRMGKEKSVLLFKEQELIQYSLNALKPYCSTILISSNKEIHNSFSYTTISDFHHQIGPIAGIYSALKNSETDFVMVLPCDSPMVKPEFVKYLISQIKNDTKAIVPQYASHLEPLFAIYHKSVLGTIEEQINKEDYKLVNLLKKINAQLVEVQDCSCFVNINTPEDYKNCL